MENQLLRRVMGFATDLKYRWEEFLLRSESLLRGLFLISDDGLDPEAPGVRPDRENVPWVQIMACVSMTAVMGVSIGYLQVRSQLHPEITLFCLPFVLALACFFVAGCIYRTFPNTARVLQNVGLYLTFTGVFIVVTVPFPSFSRVITWAVYVISVAAVLVTRYFNPQ